MSKRILSLVLTLALVLGSFSMAFADHADTTLTPQQKIDRLVEMGFVKGKDASGSDLDLQSPIKRSETSAIVSRALLSGGDKSMDAVEAEIERSRYSSRFTDVSLNSWYNPYVNVSVQEGIVEGYPNGEFRPERDIKYSEVITMMVRVLGEKPTEGVKYPDNYIGKARELGILDDIKVDYVGQAQRQGVFELLYNTLVNKGIGNYQIDKVIVLENNRVESIGANEIVVEVIKEVQRANFVDGSRKEADKEARRGQQLRITVDNDKIADSEDLLGRVIDLTYDATNKAVDVKVDNSYSYVTGKISLGSKSLKVGDRSYTVLKEEQYKNDDERIFNTYINNEDFTYENAIKKFEDLDFGRVTIKNGKVLFIDGFVFDDIAPVKDVNKDGAEIVVYSDLNDGGEKKIELDKEKVVSFDNGSFHSIDKSKISKLDVIHVGTDSKGNKVIVVRKDAQVNGVYDKVVEYRDKTVVVVDGKEYEISTAAAKKPVYSYDSKAFRTLFASDASNVLKEFKNQKVTLLKDVNGNLQYLGSEIAFGEFVGLVDKVVGKEARILKSDNTKEDFTATLDSDLKLDGTTGHQNLNGYDKGDLVFVSAKDKEINTMRRLNTKLSAPFTGTSITENYVGDYRVLPRTNVFVQVPGEEAYATTMKYVADNYDKAGFTAKVLTDFEYEGISPKPRLTFDGRKDIAHTIVFTQIGLKKNLDEKNVEITSISNRYETVEVKLPNSGEKVVYNIEKDSKAYDALRSGSVKVGDITKLGISKTDSKLVKEAVTVIPYNQQGVKITDYNERSRTIELNGVEYYLLSNVDNFVKGGIEKGKYVAFVTDKDANGNATKYITAIVDRLDGDTIAKGQITDINRAENLIKVDGEVLLLSTVVDLLNENGNSIAIGKDKVVAALQVGDVLTNINKDKNGLVVKMTLKNRTNDAQADVVIAQIAKLPANITLADEVAVNAARAAYNALSATEQAKVVNYSTLTAAEAKIAELKGETVISGEAKYIAELVGVKSYDLTISGVEASKVTSVLTNGNAVIAFEVDADRPNVIMFNTEANPVNTVQFVVDGVTYNATIK